MCTAMYQLKAISANTYSAGCQGFESAHSLNVTNVSCEMISRSVSLSLSALIEAVAYRGNPPVKVKPYTYVNP